MHLEEITLSPTPLVLQSFLIVPISIDEILVELSVVAEVLLKDSEEGIELVLFDLHHL